MAVGQAGAVLALGLNAVEQAHARQLAAAQRQQTAGLVPALVQRSEAVIQHHEKPVFHIRLDDILLPEDIKGQHRTCAAADEPALGHTGHEAHADEDRHQHQIAAHVGGYFIVQAKEHHQVYAQKQNIRQPPQRPVLLQPHQLPRQHQNKGQLHDLGGLHHHRQQREFQPRQIARVTGTAQRGFQQQDHAQAEQRQPQPPLLPHQLAHIHHRQQEKQNDADDRTAGLHQHLAHGVHIPCGGIDHQDAVGRGGTAKRQQNKVCLPQDIPQ